MIVIGILLIIFKDGIIEILLSCLGAAIIVWGIFDAVKRKNATACVIKCVLGVGTIVGAWVFKSIILFGLGGLLIIVSVLWIIKLIQYRTKGVTFWDTIRIYFVPSVIAIVGTCLFFNQAKFVDIIFIIVGAIITINGIVYLINTIKHKT